MALPVLSRGCVLCEAEVENPGHLFLHCTYACRLRGKVDSNGVCAAYLEERLNMGLNFILSEELDHKKKDYKFGFVFLLLLTCWISAVLEIEGTDVNKAEGFFEAQ
ncbi:hypothetical protein P8452_16784 [Trifolium repens]|nr:hypothetical protein P8452_16784 [Trifolium repens]